MPVLLLGGTGEARELAARLYPDTDIISSLAGRVPDPALPVGPVRIGGFGGVDGLREWLRDNDISAVIDVTHPFAATMTAHAAQACAERGLRVGCFRPPTVPAGSTVTVRTSSLQLTDTLSVPADWYFPEATVPGEAPQRMIYLAHGFFGVGAMYSYTAARLAESTGSIVVVPTVTSNPFAAGGLWINGAALQPVVADLFVGDRSALTASALAAGYAEQYGLDPADADLPRQFALSGHSAGGSLVSGVASYLVANGAVDDLVGVVLFDAVTTGDTVVDAIADLDSTGRFIPVREIGSPFNLWNFPSNVNTALSTARPDSFSGLVLAGGTHADSIQGGSALIQCAVRLLVGTSLPENVAALDELTRHVGAQEAAGSHDQ